MLMKLNKFKSFLMLAAALTCLSVASCKKDDDDDDDTPYLEGTLNFEMPRYVEPGTVITVVPSGLKTTEDGPVGYAWVLSWKSATDTTRWESDPASVTGELTFKAPKELGAYTVKCLGFAEDHYSSSQTLSLNVVSDELNTTLAGTEIRATNPKIQDPRDGREYYVTEVNGLTWFRQNLAYEGVGIPYLNCSVMSGIFGVYYNWEEAQTACPDGWRLPTEEDWLGLGKYLTGKDLTSTDKWEGVSGELMVDATYFSSTLWEYWPNVKITNSTKLGFLPFGYAIDKEGNVEWVGGYKFCCMWSAGEYSEDTEKGLYRYIHYERPDVITGAGDKTSFRASVRCVK